MKELIRVTALEQRIGLLVSHACLDCWKDGKDHPEHPEKPWETIQETRRQILDILTHTDQYIRNLLAK